MSQTAPSVITDFPLDEIRLHACEHTEYWVVMPLGEYWAARRAL
jgi:hypothetical protein